MSTKGIQPVAAALALLAVGLWTIGASAWSCLLACKLARDAGCGHKSAVCAPCADTCEDTCTANSSPSSCCDHDAGQASQAACQPQLDVTDAPLAAAPFACDCPCLALASSCKDCGCAYQPRQTPLTDDRRATLDRLTQDDRVPHAEPLWAPNWRHVVLRSVSATPGVNTLARASPRAVLCVWLN